ncbi:MAG: DUF559 domain-containing protein [Chloroflexi bacterium]|nr:DUF559 domain-containing protein [Chloroflexota bacterium]
MCPLRTATAVGRSTTELQRFIWEWPTLIDQLRAVQPRLAERLERAARPIEAERWPDGRLLLVLGCWVPEDRAALGAPETLRVLEADLKRLTGDPIQLIVTDWPAGDGPPDEPPDALRGLPEPLRRQGTACGGVLLRSFFAAAARRGIVFHCQYPVLNYRLDFALPELRLGVEIGGWQWRSWTSPAAIARRQREQELGAEGWTILWFTGEEVLHHLEQSVDEVARVIARRSRMAAGRDDDANTPG